MKISFNVETDIKTEKVVAAVDKASREGLRDTVVAIHRDTIRNARAVRFWRTGHNARSITSEVSGMGVVHQGADSEPDRVVNDSKVEGAVYSTSGYGGYGETGTVYMAPRPYFRPALDSNMHKLPKNVRTHIERIRE